MGKACATLPAFSPDELLVKIASEKANPAEKTLATDLIKASDALDERGVDGLSEDHQELLKAAGLFQPKDEEESEESEEDKHEDEDEKPDGEERHEKKKKKAKKCMEKAQPVAPISGSPDASVASVSERLERMEKAIGDLATSVVAAQKGQKKLLKALQWKEMQKSQDAPDNLAPSLPSELQSIRGVLDRTPYSPHPRQNGSVRHQQRRTGRRAAR